MWISLILASALIRQTSTGTASLSAKVVDAIDRNYLYADAIPGSASASIFSQHRRNCLFDRSTVGETP